MEINRKNNHLLRIRISFIMLLFAMCLAINALFCSNYNLYELLDKTTVNEMWIIPESVIANEDGDNTAYFNSSFLNKNHSDSETITKNMCPILTVPAIPKGFGRLFFLIIVLPLFLLSLFILLPDRWTLINQEVRLDN